MIHASAEVDPGARLADGVSVGACSIIGPGVEIGEDTWIGPHVVIQGPTRIGKKNRIYQFNSIGDIPQDKKFSGEKSRLEIGDGNVIREFCTLNRGTEGGGGVTRIGNDNWIMAYVHVAHDCQIGNAATMANGTTLAGHVSVGNFVTFGAFTLVHQFCAIGAYSFSAMGTVVFKDVPPFVTISGNSAKPHGLNTEGLKRRGFDTDVLRELRRAYKIIYKQGLTVDQALASLDAPARKYAEVAALRDFVAGSTRGVVR
ncbi:MAG: acyl-ACP--UDP-N-acetylglucosamine O-acyltransferase [Gammaproteobacteria bacterium]|nr:acyl-ACP--UDP-N-acetylglucosamine O-acyltransferase [Gammaproteobacteria bacterium]MDH3413728.1 acyl-ACP--UDP-N-acetylglucosamine O-acyltransferase [Gammaproteobacteria bacterium]